MLLRLLGDDMPRRPLLCSDLQAVLLLRMVLSCSDRFMLLRTMLRCTDWCTLLRMVWCSRCQTRLLLRPLRVQACMS